MFRGNWVNRSIKRVILILVVLSVGGIIYYLNDQAQEQDQAQVSSEPEATSAGEAETEAPVEEEVSFDIKICESGTIITEEQLNREDIAVYFQSEPIDGEVLDRISGRSYVDNPNISLADLRYLKVLHYNFEHQIQVGELIVNAALADEYKDIFRELFEAEYEINSMHLIDDYWTGDAAESDTASIEANNTSAFCYRVMTGGESLSNHAYGCAIDINPQQNPYVSYSTGVPVWSHPNADQYIDRTTGYDHVITHEDVCYQIFTAHSFTWGGDWSNPKDYQHFEKTLE